jgi:hypothetical protein
MRLPVTQGGRLIRWNRRIHFPYCFRETVCLPSYGHR